MQKSRIGFTKAVLIIVILGLMGLIGYFVNKKTQPISTELITDSQICTLKAAFDPEFMFWPGKTSTASGYPWVTGFKGNVDQVSWVSQDPSVVQILPPNTGDGSKIIKKGGKEGTTTILVTDNFVGKDCNVSFKAIIQNPKESGE